MKSTTAAVRLSDILTGHAITPLVLHGDYRCRCDIIAQYEGVHTGWSRHWGPVAVSLQTPMRRSTEALLRAFPSVRTAFDLLSPRGRRRLVLVVVAQMLTSLLDLIGVLLVAAVGVLSIQVIQGGTTVPALMQPIVDEAASFGLDFRQTTFVFALAAAIFLVGKSTISAWLSRRILLFLAHQQAHVSGTLFAKLMNQSVIEVQEQSSLTTAFAVVQGATNAVVGILGSAALVISESALLILFAVTLLWVNPYITIGAVVFLAIIALSSSRALGSWSERVGSISAETTVRGNSLVQDSITTFREISVLGRTGLYVERVKVLLARGSRAQADAALISQIPKFVYESALMVGAVALAGLLFLTSDAATAVGTMVLFLAAAGRVTPSIMRLQGAVITIRASAGSSVATFDLADRMRQASELPGDQRTAEVLRGEADDPHVGFDSGIHFESFTFRYPGAHLTALDGINLSAPAGSSLALVGATGAGKSTMADALLGVILPTSGRVTIGGLPPEKAVEGWPGAIAYVPQHVSLVEGSVRENVALGLPADAIDDDAVCRALEKAHLADFLTDQRDGIDTHVGERGVRLSGGQRQRLGLARALYGQPMLLVLDEATSALDAHTESLVSDVSDALHCRATVDVVAHRLATIRRFDQVAFLEHGRVVHTGSFEEVRQRVPAFDEQARLLGL